MKINDNPFKKLTSNKSSLAAFTEFFKQQTLNQIPGKKYYALMLFYSETDLDISDNPRKWVNVQNRYYVNGEEALNAYANTPCPASQLIDANSIEELVAKMNQMLVNFNDNDYLEKNLYPYL